MKNLQTYLNEGDHQELGDFLLDNPQYITTVADYLENGEDTQRATAAWTFQHLATNLYEPGSYTDVTEPLQEAVTDSVPEVRSGAVAAIGVFVQYGNFVDAAVEVTPDLIRLLTDPETDENRMHATYAVMQLSKERPESVAPYQDEIESVMEETQYEKLRENLEETLENLE